MRPVAIHHVTLAVTDVDEAVDFYTRVVGLRLRADRPATAGPGAWLDIGGQQVHLVHAEPPLDRGQHVALVVTDLDAAVHTLRAAGAVVTVPLDAARRAFLADPSGNAIELIAPQAPPEPMIAPQAPLRRTAGR